MSSIQTLIDQVLDQVREEESLRLEEARQKQENQLKQEKKRINNRVDQAKLQIEEAAKAELQRKEQSYLNEMRNRKLADQQDLINQVFDQAQEKLTALSSHQFTAMVQAALDQLASQEAIELRLGELSRQQLSDSDLSQLKVHYPKLSLAEDYLANQGGFILSQAGMDYNFTFKEVMANLHLRLAAEIKKRVFN